MLFPFTVLIGSVLMLLWLSRGPLYVPTKRTHLPRIIALLGVKAGERVVDLGSGDGRLMVALAEAGAEAHGYEHNPLLVWRSRRRFRALGIAHRTKVYFGDFLRVDLSSYDGVVVYGIPYIMGRLERKLRAELRPGARVVSHAFRFPNWEPVRADRGAYLYIQGSTL